MLSAEKYRYGLIGYPIGHSQSPSLFNELCEGRWEYDLLEYDNFEDSWRAFADGPYKAVNVTAPYKTLAAGRADIRSEAVRRIGAANILVKTPEGIAAHNSDFLAVRELLGQAGAKSVTVIGLGGAGRAALAAAEDLELPVRGLHHDEIAEGAADDVIIYTLPCAAPGCDRLACRAIIEANYKNPCLAEHNGYISGQEWLRAQAILGFAILTGQGPAEAGGTL